jgi:hypothetical protein
MSLGRFSTIGRATLWTGLAGVAAAAALTGCGSSGSNSSAANQVSRAAFVSTSTSGYRMRFGMLLSSSSLPQPIQAIGVGSFNVKAHTGAVRFDMNLGSSPQITQVLGSNTLRLDEVIDGTTIYVKLPTALTSRLPTFSGKPWFKVDIAKSASAAGVPGVGSLVNNPASSDPSQLLQYLRAAGTVTKVGSDVVNGNQTTHYRATIDLDKVASTVPASSRASAQAAITGLEKLTKLHQIPVGVWIDSQNLVRRMRMSFGESLPSGQTITAAITVDITGYGPQPAPVIPPASQVTDASALTGQTG